MKANVKHKFPCGYEYEQNIESGLMDFSVLNTNDKTDMSCPLHGKECKK